MRLAGLISQLSSLELSPRARALLLIGLVYLTWCLVVFCYQDRLIFPTTLSHGRAEQEHPPGRVVLHRPLAEGGFVEAWFDPPPTGFRRAPWPVVVFFHGNGERIDDQEWVRAFYHRLGWAVLLCEFRGYGRSAGRPSERGIAEDAVWFRDQIAERSDVDGSLFVYHGRSLGGGPAADLAARRPPAGLILESTFTSMAAMSKTLGVPPLFCRHPFRTDRVVSKARYPILILHGDRDRVVEVEHGRRLHALAAGSEYHEFTGYGHNDLGPGNPSAYDEAIAGFLARLPAEPRAARRSQ